MKILTLTIFAIIVSACGPNVLTVKSGRNALSGFYGPDGKVYTARHGIDEENNIELSAQAYFVGQLEEYRGEDIAVINPDIEYYEHFEWCGGIDIGDRLKMASAKRLSYGNITRIGKNFVKSTLRTKKGDSGAPVYNLSKRCVLGIHVGRRDGFAVAEIVR